MQLGGYTFQVSAVVFGSVQADDTITAMGQRTGNCHITTLLT